MYTWVYPLMCLETEGEVLMVTVCACSWRLRFRLRLLTVEVEVRSGDGAGGGVGAGATAGMGAGMGVEAEATESSGTPPGDPKIRILGPNAIFGHSVIIDHASAAISGATFETRKMSYSLPATGHSIPIFTWGFSLKAHFQKNPMVGIRIAPPALPPFSSISLQTAHARNTPPATVEAVRQLRLRLWLAVCAGRSRSGWLGPRSGSGCLSWSGWLRSGFGQISVSI